MERLREIVSGLAILLVIVAVFVTTQIGDAEGRTLVGRVPYAGPFIEFAFLGGGYPADGPMVRSHDEDLAIVDHVTCGHLREADDGQWVRVADAFLAVWRREDARADAIPLAVVVEAMGDACAERADDLLVADALLALDEAEAATPAGG